MIQFSKPLIGKEEERAVQQVLRSGNLAQGKVVKAFEEQFASYMGTKYAVATSNGTIALFLSLLALGIGKGDEVITTPFTFIATANAILYTGATPVFVDIEEETLNIDPNLIEAKITSRSKAIIPVHLFGLPANMSEVMRIAKKHKLKVIEDACQAHGAALGKKRVGSFGIAGCFSFYPTKNMTTGEGGIITTNNKKLAETLAILRNHGMKKRYYHNMLGYNYRMTDISAAIGIEQLKKIERFIKLRKEKTTLYTHYLSKIQGIRLPAIPSGYKHVFHQYTIRTKSSERNTLIKKLADNNIPTMIYYPLPIHKQKFFKKFGYRDILPVAERAAREVLSLPIHPGLREEDIRKIVSVVKKASV